MKVLACFVLALATFAHAIEDPSIKDIHEKRGVIGFGYGAYTAPALASYAAPLPYGKLTVATPALAYTAAPAVPKFTYAAPALQYTAAPAVAYATAPAFTYPTVTYAAPPPPPFSYAAAPAIQYAAGPAPAVAKLTAYAAPAAYAPHVLPPYAAAPVPYGYSLGYGAKYVH